MSARSRRRARQQAQQPASLDPNVEFVEPNVERLSVEEALVMAEAFARFFAEINDACIRVSTALADFAARMGEGDEPEQADEEAEVDQPEVHDTPG